MDMGVFWAAVGAIFTALAFFVALSKRDTIIAIFFPGYRKKGEGESVKPRGTGCWYIPGCWIVFWAISGAIIGQAARIIYKSDYGVVVAGVIIGFIGGAIVGAISVPIAAAITGAAIGAIFGAAIELLITPLRPLTVTSGWVTFGAILGAITLVLIWSIDAGHFE
jgi:hypothetical protein